MMPRSIAKVNAKSIDGFFGVGTPCFFIRGTILSDTPVNGEYPSLSFTRPGNVIEVVSFDRIWAVVIIRTREGNRPGDNITARLYLRDDDLKAHGVDCERLEALYGLPYSIDVASLAAATPPDHKDLEPYQPVAGDPDPPLVASSNGVAHAAPVPPPAALRTADVAPAAPSPPAPPPRQPVSEKAPELSADGTVAEKPLPAFDLHNLLARFKSGAPVAALAIPVLLYLALAFFRRSSDD